MGDDSSLSGTDSPPSAQPPATVDSTRAVQLSTAFTVLMALVLAGGMAFLVWLQMTIPPLDRVAFPERALFLMVSQTLDVEEAIAHAPAWERLLYQLTTDNGSSDLNQAIAWYRELSRVTFNPEIHLQRATLEAEAGHLEEVRQEVAEWDNREVPFPLYARLIYAAYLDRKVDRAVEDVLQAELADALPSGWFYTKLAMRLAERSGDESRTHTIRAEWDGRVMPLLERVRLLTSIELGIMLIGLVALALPLRGRHPYTVSTAPLPPLWRGRVGVAVLIRGAALGLLLSVAVLLWETHSLLLRLLSIPLAGLPLLALTRQYLLAPYGLGFVGGFGLVPLRGGWSRLVTAALAVLAIGLVGEWGLGQLAEWWGVSSHWTEWFDADLAWGSLPEVMVSLLEFIVLAPIFEEVAFRGVLFGTLRKKFSWGWSAVLSAGIFALAHGYGVLGFISVFWSGMLWAWIYEKTGSLLPSMFAHAANNLLVCLSILYLLRA